MTLIGLDLNANRARAVTGPAQALAVPLCLEGSQRDLALALRLEGKTPVVGSAGLAVARLSPHLACLDFLAYLGTQQTWGRGKARLDSSQALRLVFDTLLAQFGRGVQGIVMTRPTSLAPAQVDLLTDLAGQARWPLLASVAAPVAAVLAAHPHAPWSGLTLVGDCDSTGFTWTALVVDVDSVRLLDRQVLPRLGRNTWLQRLVDGVANRCLRISQRDPRLVPETDQALFDQLGHFLEQRIWRGLVEIHLQGPQWSQFLQLHPDEIAGFCAPLIPQVLERLRAYQSLTSFHGPLAAVVLTDAVQALPGLVEAIDQTVAELAPGGPRLAPPTDLSDFGEGLLLAEQQGPARVHLLDSDALAMAAHGLAGTIARGELQGGVLDIAPLAGGPPVDSGPPRLQFQGEDHYLSFELFTLGRDPKCNLVFATDQYPTVSARHCEVFLDRDSFTLRDCSRHGTLVNDRRVYDLVPLHSGDWIRLGPDGPVLRFLGQPTIQRRLYSGS